MLAASTIPLVALFQVFDATGAVTNGILRARGRQVCSYLQPKSATHVPPNIVYWSTFESFVCLCSPSCHVETNSFVAHVQSILYHR